MNLIATYLLSAFHREEKAFLPSTSRLMATIARRIATVSDAPRTDAAWLIACASQYQATQPSFADDLLATAAAAHPPGRAQG